MIKLNAICSSILLLILSFTTAPAQNERNNSIRSSAVTVTAISSFERVRFTAPSSVVQIRLEIYNTIGKKLFDNEVRGGNVLDWHLRDGQAEPLADDSYLCVVTVKSLSGKISERIGLVTVAKSSASVQSADGSRITAQQAQAIGPLEDNASFTVLNEDETRTATIIAHDGTEGQITRGKGALSFRIGDFFSGRETEQMRLTPEGNLGIGITHPQARLDVDGVIRSTQGIVFPDGSVQYSAARRTFGTASQRPGQFGKDPSPGQEHFETQESGSGTQNRLAKWLDNAGTLGDSAIVDIGGSIGIGTTNPQSGLDYRNSGAAFFTRDIPINPGGAQSALQLGLSNAGSRNAGVGPSFLFFGENSAGAKSFLGRVSGVWENPTAGGEAGAIFFQVRANSADVNALTERMRINSNGNVGIGTTAPATPLEVNGLVRSTRSGVAPQYIQLNGGDSGSIKLTAQSTLGAEKSLFIQNLSGEPTPGTNNIIQFQVGTAAAPSTKMIIDNNGNVGIGTLSPDTALSVRCNATRDCVNVSNTDPTGAGGIFASGTSGNARGGVIGHPSAAAIFVGASTYITGDSTPLPQTLGLPGGLVMGSAPNSGVAYISAHDYNINMPMTLALQTSGGRIGINTTGPDQTLTVNGNASKPGGGSWAVFSDERLKDIKGGFTPGLKAVMKLQPLRYEYKRDNALGIKSEGEHVGFGAQAVQKIIPEAVMKNDKGYLLVNNDPIMLTMLNAIKEQQLRIERLSKEVRQLRAASNQRISRGVRRP